LEIVWTVWTIKHDSWVKMAHEKTYKDNEEQ
jgi:hypothetical protein